MNIAEYNFIDPEHGSVVHQSLRQLARRYPWRAARLVTALEEAASSDVYDGYRIAPDMSGDSFEVYMIPPRYVLRAVPDAVALISINHRERVVQIVCIWEIYGDAAEEEQWICLSNTALDVWNAQKG